MLETIIGYTIAILIYFPINIFIHECGHAFFVKVFGGDIKNIHIGIGEPLFKRGNIIINKYFFMFGLAEFESTSLKINNKFTQFLIGIGGVLFNVISLVIVILIFNLYDPGHFLKGYYIGFTSFLIFSALIPVTYPHGYDSDGKLIMKLFKK